VTRLIKQPAVVLFMPTTTHHREPASNSRMERLLQQ
jgi:hypothetical protein